MLVPSYLKGLTSSPAYIVPLCHPCFSPVSLLSLSRSVRVCEENPEISGNESYFEQKYLFQFDASRRLKNGNVMSSQVSTCLPEMGK